ncbi:hypothetical protein EYF80_059282 [Liparis tanakae]|uniref:Uncharacterized protein n=1 Tax=Liparis tanakae TaxID=230148 RepID=A0A4Z2ENQ7_9TELE|nr:hypothetical protein EYF80_059282 [Liparis tanakae]
MQRDSQRTAVTVVIGGDGRSQEVVGGDMRPPALQASSPQGLHQAPQRGGGHSSTSSTSSTSNSLPKNIKEHHSTHRHSAHVERKQVVLEPPVVHVPPAALRAVDQRLPQEAEPRSALPAQALRPAAGGPCRQQPVPRGAHRLPPGLDIFQAVALGAVARRRSHPEPGAAAAFVSAVVAGHGITEAGIQSAEGLVEHALWSCACTTEADTV